MNTEVESLTFNVPLAIGAHSVAQQFRCRQENAQKGKQVYLNTLAVYAVNYYLECQGFETDLANSNSWDALAQQLMDVADLEVKGYGKLECRPVLPGAEFVEIPESLWEDRIGYVAVQFSESLQEATLLGFADRVSSSELPLTKLQNLADFPLYLSQFKEINSADLVKLSNWLDQIFAQGWQTIEDLFNDSPAQLAVSFRNSSTSPEKNTQIRRGRRLVLPGINEQLNLCVAIQPTDSAELDISVEIYPAGEKTYLPVELKLILLDEQENLAMQAIALSSESLEFQFSGEPGEVFTIKVALGDTSVTEKFVI